MKTNRQHWWISLAGLIGVFEAVMAVGFTVDPEGSTGDKVLGAFVGVAFILVFAGLWQRRKRLRRGNSLMIVGIVPALLAGVVFFWFPPMWLVTITTGIVMVKAAEEALAAGWLQPV